MSSSDAHAPAVTTRIWRTTSTRSRSRTTPSGWGCGCSWAPRCCCSPASSSATRSTATSITRPSTRRRATWTCGPGTTNTVVLITSCLTVALAYLLHQAGTSRSAAPALLIFTILCALAFLVIKAIEYHHKFEEGALPGAFYHYAEVTAPGREPVLHDLLPVDGPARVPRHRRDVDPDLGAGARPEGALLAVVLRAGRAGRPLLAPRRPGLDLPFSAAVPDLRAGENTWLKQPRTRVQRQAHAQAHAHGHGPLLRRLDPAADLHGHRRC